MRTTLQTKPQACSRTYSSKRNRREFASSSITTESLSIPLKLLGPSHVSKLSCPFVIFRLSASSTTLTISSNTLAKEKSTTTGNTLSARRSRKAPNESLCSSTSKETRRYLDHTRLKKRVNIFPLADCPCRTLHSCRALRSGFLLHRCPALRAPRRHRLQALPNSRGLRPAQLTKLYSPQLLPGQSATLASGIGSPRM